MLFGFGAVGGGYANTANAYAATVGGGEGNTASGGYAIVSGGQYNTAGNAGTTVGGGRNNVASGEDRDHPRRRRQPGQRQLQLRGRQAGQSN